MKPSLWRLTLYNLLRRPGRSAAAALGVLLVAATLFAGGLITQGVRHAVDVGLDRLGADLMVVPAGAGTATHKALVMGEPAAFYMEGQVAAQVAEISGVKSVSPQVYVETLASAACCTGRLFLIGFDPASDFTVKPWLTAQLGRDLEPDEILVGNHVLSMPGESMRFFGTDFRVVNRLDPTGMGMDETVFLPVASVAEMAQGSITKAEKPLTIPPGHVSSVLVRLADRDALGRVKEQIEHEIPGVAVVTPGQVTEGVTRDLSGLMGWLLPIAGGVLLISLMIFLILFAAIASERSREIGLLRAMGATARQAVASLLGEAALLGGLGGLAGVGLGLALYAIFQERILVHYTLPFLWPSVLQQVLLGVAVVLLCAGLAIAAAAIPAWRIAHLEPHHAIHRTIR